ncbi:hypothetical protein [Flavivirga eckloniae]|uniref:Uncharacterized protein n=1 Tax=Flavivirga eckloniae TaxID=1803846 RepID=A0A2K9PK85_9FLAO|nr:hypothetical protein [Flavivirga eckloniae]AUP77268.1 hypothetical protein C1H87_00455 [Flavivirga eckloniae]
MEGFILNKISFEDDGKKICYDYSVAKSFSKYFNLNNPYYSKYQINVSDIPESIAVIPLLANLMPIAWFVGFDVHINEVDETFYNALINLKEEFTKYHPNKSLKGDLVAKSLIKNTISENKSALLFSGGLDSFESYTRNYDLNPYLISIHGADIEIGDTKRWEDFKRFNKEEHIVPNDMLQYIETNVRDFYTYKIELLVDIGWWGKIQHGMALLGVLAPLSYKLNFDNILIGSSNTNEVDFGWGSSPNIDEKMKWATCNVIHDGYHLRRTNKVENVVSYVNTNNTSIKLRVCYSELRNGANCNKCAKCQRTILGIILANDNPEKFGLEVPDNFYDRIFSNFNENTTMSKGLEYEWWCLQEKVKENKPFFVIEDEGKEKELLKKFVALDLKQIINKNEEKVNKLAIKKFIIRNKFSKLYEFYKRIRYNKI